MPNPKENRAQLIAAKQALMLPKLEMRLNAATLFEQENGLVTGDGFDLVSVVEIATVISSLFQSNVKEAYDVLARAGESGVPYYDIFIAPQHTKAHEALAQALELREPQRVRNGLDIATGTGNTAVVLAGVCDNIVAIDTHRGMLDRASEKLGKLKDDGKLKSFQVSQVDIANEAFSRANSGKFDLVVCNGIEPYLTFEQMTALNHNIFRLLKPGGRSYAYTTNWEPNSPPTEYETSPKARFAALVSGMLMSLTGQLENMLKVKTGLVDPIVLRNYHRSLELFKEDIVIVNIGSDKPHKVSVSTKKTGRELQGINLLR